MRKTLVLMSLIAVRRCRVPRGPTSTNTVDLGECGFVGNGHTTVPAGSTLILEETWLDTTVGAVRRFLRVQSTTAAIDGDAVAATGALWGPVRRLAEFDAFATTWSYEAGVLASRGDAMIVAFDVTLTRELRDGEGNVYPEGSIFGGPISCAIVAV